MSSGSYYEEEMSSGGHRRLTAFILWPFSPSKKSPLDPPSPWSWLGAYGGKIIDIFGYRFIFVWDFLFTGLGLIGLMMVYRVWKRRGGRTGYTAPEAGL